jgi:NAD-dependent SIR2 family protein deacetylase
MPVEAAHRYPSPAESAPVTSAAVASYDAAINLVATGLRAGHAVVLTGAGLSTDSGIPDYRGPTAIARSPMTFQEFTASPANQRRYWARSFVGWTRMAHAEPNAGHRALSILDPTLLITQNVDGLHERAGSRRMVALHGRIADVVCLRCRRTLPREAFQARLHELNPDFLDRFPTIASLPDGDADLAQTDGAQTDGAQTDGAQTEGFRVPGCAVCNGLLKPDVVFFGENVPASRVERCYAAVDRLVDHDGVLLVAGSSLTVMSGLRFVRRAASQGTSVVIVNRGATRGDDLATHRIDVGCSEFLGDLVAAYGIDLGRN